MKLNRDAAADLLHATKGAKVGDWTKVDDVLEDTGRWEEYRQCVVSGERGSLWAFDYSQGLTELQESDWFDHGDEVGLYPVIAIPVTVIEYQKVPE